MEERKLSRRAFVRAVRNSAVLLILPKTAPQALPVVPRQHSEQPSPSRSRANYRLRFFTRREAETVEAVTARMIPSDETPGAREARVVDFIDHILVTAYATQQLAYREGLRRLNALAQRRFTRQFARLAARDQDALLVRLERGTVSGWKGATDFFLMVREHTIEGMFADPKYRGNANEVGWHLIGSSLHRRAQT